MNFSNFSSRRGARGIIFGLALASGSTLAFGMQEGTNQCGIRIPCPVDGDSFMEDDSDTWGEDFIPDIGAVTLSVNEFDAAAAAAFHGVPLSDIHLLKAELSVHLEVTEMERHLSNILTPCTFEWSWPVSMSVLANAQVGTPEFSTPDITPSDNSGPLNPGDNYDWTLAIDGGGPQSSSVCYLDTSDMDDWIGNGQIDFDVSQLATPSDMGCANAAEQRFVRGIVEIEVVYTYCVAEEVAECFLVIGSGRGFDVVQPANYPFATQVRDVNEIHEVLTTSIPQFIIPQAGHPSFGTGSNAFGNVGISRSAYRTFAVEVVMYNPEVFPTQPEHHSNGLFVYIDHYGNVASIPYGSGTMSVWAQTGVNAAGKRYVKFPFTIPQ